MYAAFCGSKNELVNFTLPTKALLMGLPILQEARKKRQKGEENPTNNSNREHKKIIPTLSFLIYTSNHSRTCVGMDTNGVR